MNDKLKILVADDLEANLRLVAKFLERRGHDVLTAYNGEEAINQFKQHGPDLVLLDIMMPGVDGYQAAEEIKKLSGDRWVPVIFLSALAKGEDQVRGLEAGADDYLPKPINLEVLDAKIKAMQRIAHIQNKLAETTRALQDYHAAAEQEQEMANKLLERIIYSNQLQDELIQYWQMPASRFSGDIVLATRGSADRLFLLQADSTGHGLTAALPLMHISQVFFQMARKGFALSSIVSEMNSAMKRLMPTERFVAGTAACIDSRNRMIEIWNGASPTALFVNGQGKVLKEFAAEHLALGVVDGESFDSGTAMYPWPEAGKLVLFSDGLLEAQNAADELFGDERVTSCLTQADGKDPFTALRGAVKTHLGAGNPHDDISLLVIRCD